MTHNGTGFARWWQPRPGLTWRHACAGRLEFKDYLPETTQAAIIHPIGSDGVVVVGTDTQRGFTTLDQASSGGLCGQHAAHVAARELCACMH